MSDVPQHFFTQSAVVPYRWREGRPEFLLITSRKKRRWVLPKGVREPELTFADSAAKEALEEAGIEGRVEAVEIGVYQYPKWGGTCTVRVFAMEVETMREEWAESFRDRVWMTPEEAARRVEEVDLRTLLLALGRRLEAAASEERPA